MYLTHTPTFVQRFFKGLVWRMNPEKKTIFLTFDDGPIPEVTPWVLDILRDFSAKATFFCVGENISKHPELFYRIQSEGHSVGSHTYNHLSGWAVENAEYIRNVRKASLISGSKLFRPPYGRIKPSQARIINHHFDIIMWDVLSGDFDPMITKEACYENVIHTASSGSIIVFHDSVKSKEKLYFALPKVLEYFSSLGYAFDKIESNLERKKIGQMDMATSL